MHAYQHILILGAGAWGTALSVALARPGRRITLWSNDAQQVEEGNRTHRNPLQFSDVVLPEGVVFSTEIVPADVVFLVLPAEVLLHHLPAMGVDKVIAPGVPVVVCAKGLLGEEGLFLSDIVAQHLPKQPVVILSGPNFASEVVHGKPAATTIACEDQALGMALLSAFGSSHFRPYYSQDVRGVQVAGAVKNVLAIAAGIAMGKGLGENARAALLTRGLAEMQRLVLALGGHAETVLGLAGVGDLILTAGSPTSRNMAFGVALGQGASLEALLQQPITREGYPSAKAIASKAKHLGIEMPICEAVYQVLYKGVAIDDAMQTLLQRPFGSEI